ncbi:MAG: hypothetical protein V2J20_04940 [Wenzhouxiangella sp.]|jgi:hypothetical protein|nr:hypothetical protein [Wenzhouxiangella sp.]
MSEYAVLRDDRLAGSLPGSFTRWWHDLNVIGMDSTTRLRTAFRRLNALRREHGKLHTIFVLCHGFAGASENLQMSGDFGGQGLQLGFETVLHSNVSMWSEVRDVASNMVIYACAASNTEAGNGFTKEDGRYLMGALAIHTNSFVYAGDRIQWYNPANFDFGTWEGQLFKFPPSGQEPTPVTRPPVEFRQLISVI